jgi:hypothetical protein
MVPLRRIWFSIAVLTLVVQTSYSQEPAPLPALEDHYCVIYSLADLCDDPSLGKWVAETIPDVIESSSWNRVSVSGKKNVISYYAPKKILIVSHSSGVQKKVSEFLKGVKSATAAKEKIVAATKSTTTHSGVVPASYQAPAGLPVQNSISPLPMPVQQPKHLFHFIIRYEGAGIIDDSVNKFMKLQKEEKTENNEKCCPHADDNTARKIGSVLGAVTGSSVPAIASGEENGERYIPATLPVMPASESVKKEAKQTMPRLDD